MTARRYCECDLRMSIVGKMEARPSANCPIHRTLAERWDRLKGWQEYYDALKVDSPEIESFDKWIEKP